MTTENKEQEQKEKEKEKEKRTWHNPVTEKDYPVAELPTRKNITGIWNRHKRKKKE